MDTTAAAWWCLGAGIVGLLVLHEINAHIARRKDPDVTTPETAALRATPLGQRPALKAVRAETRSAAGALLDAVDGLHAAADDVAHAVQDLDVGPRPPVRVLADDDLVHLVDLDETQLADLTTDGSHEPPPGSALLFRCGTITTAPITAQEVGRTDCPVCSGAAEVADPEVADPGGGPR